VTGRPLRDRATSRSYDGGVSTPPRNVAVIFGGPSPEHDVSVLTGLQACRALESSPAGAPIGVYWSKNGDFFTVPVDLEAPAFATVPTDARPITLEVGSAGGFVEPKGRFGGRANRLEIDAALICCHGGPGEDGHLQGSLDLAGIAYSGPSAEGAAWGMDKLATGAVAVTAGIPSLPRALLSADGAIGFDGQYIVKPRYGGSSIGIDVVADEATARQRLVGNVHLRRGAVIEPYRPDLGDLQIAVRSWPSVELSQIERPIRRTEGNEILDYADKYVGGTGMDAALRDLPADLPEPLAERIRAYARIAAEVLSIRGVARIDFLSDGDELYFNEVNTIPGSLSRYLFVEPMLAFTDLLADLLVEAVERPTARFSAAGADGSVLRSASTISSKLG
jgi:D-alanine-D-alanine ligase